MIVIFARTDDVPGAPIGDAPDLNAVRTALATLSREGHGNAYVVVTLGAMTPRGMPEAQMWDVRQPVGMPRPLGYMPESYARPWVAAARRWTRAAA